MGTRDILLRLDEAAFEQLRKAAFESRTSMSEVLRQALDLRLQGSGCSSCVTSRAALARAAALLGKVSGQLQGELQASREPQEKGSGPSWDDFLASEGP